MPQMGFDMTQGTLVRWLKSEGELVTRGEAIAEIETDKAVVELEAFASGVLRKILVKEGTVVPVGQAIGIIAAPDEELVGEIAAGAPPPISKETPQPTVAAVAPAPIAEEALKASPLARRIAQEQGIDLRRVTGSGPSGRIVEKDVLGFASQGAAAPTPPKEAVSPAVPAASQAMSAMRQAIARRMSQSKREAPHFYVTAEIDMTDALKLRQGLNEALEGETRVSINDLIVKAAAKALAKFPQINAHFIDGSVQVQEQINIGIAIALEEGLIAPAILDCASKSLVDIAKAAKDLVDRAKAGVLRPQEYMGGTFTVSNLGMYDVDRFTAIINPPQVAILAVGSVRERPLVRNGAVVIAQTMNATVSADHRATDGAGAAQFLSLVKRLLENPVSLLV